MEQRKRQIGEGGAPEEPDFVKRQKRWHGRAQAQEPRLVNSTVRDAWRPRPIYRTSAKNFLASIDNQIRQCDWESPGLSMFQMDKSKAVWADGREWPHLAIPHDQGSDQQCGVNALIYHYKLNCDRYPDGDHQAQRSVWQVLHATDLYPFWMLMTTAWNFVDGPDKNSYRWRQLAEATTDVREQSSARTNVSFQTYVGAMTQELIDSGYEFENQKDIDLEVWDVWAARSKARPKPERTVANRFQATLATAKREIRSWHMDLFETEHLVLEKDWMHGKKLMSRLLAKKEDLRPDDEEAVASTSNALKIEDRTLRLACENAAVIRYVMLASPTNKRIVETVLGALIHIKDWRTHMVKECKSAEGSRAWLRSMASTGVMEHVNSGLHVLNDPECLAEMRFLRRAGAYQISETASPSRSSKKTSTSPSC